MIEVGNQGIAHAKLIRGEDELVGPALELLQLAIGTNGRLCGTGSAHTYTAHTMTFLLRFVHDLAGFLAYKHLL